MEAYTDGFNKYNRELTALGHGVDNTMKLVSYLRGIDVKSYETWVIAKHSMIRSGTVTLDTIQVEVIDEYGIRKSSTAKDTATAASLAAQAERDRNNKNSSNNNDKDRAKRSTAGKNIGKKDGDICHIHKDWNKKHTNFMCYQQHSEQAPDGYKERANHDKKKNKKEKERSSDEDNTGSKDVNSLAALTVALATNPAGSEPTQLHTRSTSRSGTGTGTGAGTGIALTGKKSSSRCQSARITSALSATRTIIALPSATIQHYQDG